MYCASVSANKCIPELADSRVSLLYCLSRFGANKTISFPVNKGMSCAVRCRSVARPGEHYLKAPAQLSRIQVDSGGGTRPRTSGLGIPRQNWSVINL